MSDEGRAAATDRGRTRLVLGGIAVAHLVLGALLFEPILFSGGDNVRYMIVGEALRSGLGFLDLHLPTTPLHTKYPPVYPGLLAVLGLVGDLQLFKVASLALTTGTVVLTGWLGARLFRPVIGLAAAAVVAVNPVLLQYAHWVLSEAPFVFLVTATLVAWEAWEDREPAEKGADASERPEDGGARWGDALPGPALALAVAAFLTRTVGLSLLVVAVVLPLLRRRWRAAARTAAVTVVVAGGWALYQSLAAPETAGYLAELLMVDPYDPSQGRIGAAGLLGRTAENVWLYVGAVLPAAFVTEPAAGRPSVGLAGFGLGGLVFAAAVAGWIRRSLERLGPSELFAVVYAGIIALWPSVWTDQRFLLPLLPLVAVYGLGGAGWAIERAAAAADGAPRARRLAVGGLAAIAVVLGVRDAAGRIPSRIDCFAGWQRGEPCIHPGYRAFFELARWTREHTPPDAVVANRKPAFFWWFGRRRGDVYPFSGEPDVVLRGLDEMGATHVVLDAMFATTLRYLSPAVLARQDRFRLVHRTGPPETFLLRYLPEPKTAVGSRGGPALVRRSGPSVPVEAP